MAAQFPLAETGLRLELDLDGSGAYATDITAYLRAGSGVSIIRGLQSEGGTAGPASMGLTLDNSDHRFSPRNPLGPYYGQLTKNTAIRASTPAALTYLDAPSGLTSVISAPDSVPLSITGTIDIRMDLELTAPQGPGVWSYLLQKWTAAGNQRSWITLLGPDGRLWISSSPDGTATVSTASTAAVPRGPKRQTLRVLYTPNNGAGGHTASFWTGPGVAGPWTQIGATVTTAGATSIYDSTASVVLGDLSANLDMKAYGIRIYSGDGESGGTLVADLDLTAVSPGATTVTDSRGNVWTPSAGATLVTRDVRFTGVVPDWTMGHGWIAEDSEVEVKAYDVLRRISGSAGRLESAYRRACTSTVAPVTGLRAYWPMEDAQGSTLIASGLASATPMTIAGSPTLEGDSASFLCSDPLPKMTAGASFTGSVPAYAGTGKVQAWVLLAVPVAGVGGGGGTKALTLTCSGSAPIWHLSVNSAGELQLDAVDQNGVSLMSSGWGSLGVNGKTLRIGVLLEQIGSDVHWTVTTLEVGQTNGLFIQGTLAGKTVSQALRVDVAPDAALTDCTVGHITVQDTITSMFDLGWQLYGYSGETAAQRILRLCREEGIPCQPYGTGDVAMGPQRSGRLIDLLREAETADAGILFSPRGRSGIAYRSTDSMSARDASLSVSYTSGGITDCTPNDDDQRIRNDIELQRTGGSKYRRTLTSGPMSVLDPPDGVGLYEGGGGASINLYTDRQLIDRVGWELHRGTIDESRFPAISFDLGATTYRDGTAGQVAQQNAIMALDIGDRFAVSDLPGWGSPDGADQIMIGYRENIAPWSHEIAAVCLPASAYRAFVYGETRYSGEGTVLDGAVSSTAQTEIPILSPAGVTWTHADGDYTVSTGGERMTVTSVASTQLAPNGAFPANVTGWSVWAGNGTTSWDGAVFHTASGSAKLVTGADVDPSLEMDATVPVTPGEVITAAAWLRAGTTRNVALQLNWYDSGGNWLGQDVDARSVTANTWTQYSVTATAPAGAAAMDISADGYYGGSGAGLTFWLDDVSLTSQQRQTLTVTRGTNGILKTHSSGQPIDVAEPGYWAL